MEFKNIFRLGTVDKDSDERFTSVERMIDASNVAVVTSDSAQKGVLKNVLGNIKRSSYNITGAKTIGVGVNTNKNLIYNFISATDHDYIIEFDANDNSSEIVLQSTVGSRLNFNPNKRILNVDIIPNEDGEGDLLAWSGDDNEPRIINIDRAKTWGIDGFTAEEIRLVKPQPVYSPTLVGLNSISNEQSNNLKDRFISFAYRFRYKDGYYSAVSSWSRYFFLAGNFELDFDTFENLGMLNTVNAVNVTFNTGGREVERVDLVFKLSNSTVIYLVEKFNKEENGWADNSDQTILFDNSKVYQILPESEYFRSFDNVPDRAYAQTVAGNRLMYGNFYEGNDLIDIDGDPVIMGYTLSVVSNEIENITLEKTTESKEYDYEDPPVTIADAVIVISLLDGDGNPIELKQGGAIFINFDIKSNTEEIVFNYRFAYYLNDDYDDAADLVTNSDLAAQLDQFTLFFEENGGVTLPDGAIGYEILQGFGVTADGDNLEITLPIVKYEIDESPDPNTFIYDYFQEVNSFPFYQNIGVGTSLHSRRSYEICMIYRDDAVRKTTALVSPLNTIFIDHDRAIFQNRINVNIPTTQKPPAWATTYKFGIKINKGNYEEVYASKFLVDGSFRWIQLEGESRNKVKEGDILLVKKDAGGFITDVVTTKVLEIKQDIVLSTNDFVNQGLWMRIRPTNFEIDYDSEEFLSYTDTSAITTGGYISIFLGGLKRWNPDTMAYEDIPIGQGSSIRMRFKYSSGFEGSVPPDSFYEFTYTVQNDYASFEDWWNAEIDPSLPLQSQEGDDFSDFLFVTGEDGNRYLMLRFPNNSFLGRLSGLIVIRNVDGFFIFETMPPDIDDGIFYETPEIYNVVDGEHEMEDHLLTETYNCFAFGNGAESYQIRDAFNEKYISIDFCPTAVSEDQYRRVHKFADITYSEIFNANTNVNGLNVFNLSLANFKDDIEKRYGSIIKMKGFETNLEVYQQDKVSIVYYGKDLLFNADGTTNLTGIPQVLGQQVTLDGEYGTQYPDSFDFYGFSRYVADPKRGVIIKKANNGLFPISSQLMEFYFRSLFRDNTIVQINGKYDQFNGTYIINIQYTEPDSEELQYVTWLYSDKYDGWLTRHTFNPEDMTRLNGQFYSFKNGEVYQHNQTGVDGDNYNIFYGESFPSTFAFNFSQEPSTRKNFKTISIEGNDAWETTLKTDFDEGYIAAADFVREEGVWRGYQRVSNDVVDTSLLSIQGIGSPTIAGLVLTFATDIPSTVSVGDRVLNATEQLVGIIQDMTRNTLTMDTVDNIVSGDFVMASKNQSVEVGALLGYYERVDMELEKNTLTEVFAVNAEVAKSFI